MTHFNTALITSAVCVACGACCSAYVRSGTADVVLLEEAAVTDTVETVSCRHLTITEGEHLCGQYQDRPVVCREYNCLQKANAQDYNLPDTNALGSRIRAAVRQVHGREIDFVLTK